MPASFLADAVLFDMDGTLTDSISAVEAAWAKVAMDIGEDPALIIAMTHGKRAKDNLGALMEIQDHEMDAEVAAFENSILFYADAYHKHGPGSRLVTRKDSNPSSGALTPALSVFSSSESSSNSSAPSSAPLSRQLSSTSVAERPAFLSRLSEMLVATALELEQKSSAAFVDDKERFEPEAWQLEAASVNRSVKILPGVRRMLASIPKGRYAVATSGAKTYAHGCMHRVGITPPAVTITADDKRLTAGKPAPDPFLLAAECLGFKATNCVVFEDSPSGIRSGVASGATVIAVCTSHERAQIEGCGAHYIVEDMAHVDCKVIGQGDEMKLEFTILD